MRKNLTRKQRLRGRNDVTRLFQQSGKRVGCAGMALRTYPNRLPYNRVLLAPVRSVGGAVTRNQVKRWLRHDYAAVQHRLRQGYDLAFLVYPAHGEITHQNLRGKMLGLLRQTGLLQPSAASEGKEA